MYVYGTMSRGDRERWRYVYFLVFEAFAEIVVDVVVADLGEEGQVGDANLLLARRLKDSLAHNGLARGLLARGLGGSSGLASSSLRDSLRHADTASAPQGKRGGGGGDRRLPFARM
jgi:hypothetical protein